MPFTQRLESLDTTQTDGHLAVLMGAGVVWPVFDVVVARTPAMIAGAVGIGSFTLLWAVPPMVKRAG